MLSLTFQIGLNEVMLAMVLFTHSHTFNDDNSLIIIMEVGMAMLTVALSGMNKMFYLPPRFPFRGRKK